MSDLIQASNNNIGFVPLTPTEIPTAVPVNEGNPDSAYGNCNMQALAFTFTTTDAVNIVEYGFYQRAYGEGGTVCWGIYTNDSSGAKAKPNALVSGSEQTLVVTNTEGWKRKTDLSISLSENTIYWLAFACSVNQIQFSIDGVHIFDPTPNRSGSMVSQSENLPDTWYEITADSYYPAAIYTKYGAGSSGSVGFGGLLNGGLLSGGLIK